MGSGFEAEALLRLVEVVERIKALDSNWPKPLIRVL